jgi:hypothetical protein
MAGNKKRKRKSGPRQDFQLKQEKARADRVRRKAKKVARIERANQLPLGHPLNRHRIEQVFMPIERLLDEQESTGSMLFDEDGNAVMRDADGDWFPFVPATLQMTHLYDLMARSLTWSAQPPGLRAYALKLSAKLPITQQDIEDARVTIAWMRSHIATVSPAKWTEIFTLACELDERHEARMREAVPAVERAAA